MILTLTFNTLPLSLNRMYPTLRNGRRVLSAEGKAFKEMVKYVTTRSKTAQGFVFDHNLEYLSTEVFYYSPKLYTAKGKINRKKTDTSNNFKALEDAIFEALGIDDCYNLDVNACVRYSKRPVIVVVIRTHLLSTLVDFDPDKIEN